MLTNMIVFKYAEYMCTRLKLLFQSESNKHRIKTGNQKHAVQTWEINTNNKKITKSIQRRLKICEITY